MHARRDWPQRRLALSSFERRSGLKQQRWSSSLALVVLGAAQVAWAWPNGAGSSVGVHGGGYHGGAKYSGSHGMPSSGGGYFRGSGMHGSIYGNHGAAGAHVGPGYSSPHAFMQPPMMSGAPYSYPGGAGFRGSYQGLNSYIPGWLGWGYGGFGWGFPGWGFGFGFWPYFDYGTAWGLYGGYGGYQGYGSYGFGYPHEDEEDGYTPAPSALQEELNPERQLPSGEPATPTPDDDSEVQVAAPEMNVNCFTRSGTNRRVD